MEKTPQLNLAIAALFTAVAQANHVTEQDVKDSFAVAPAAVQSMVDEISLSSELLQKINIVGKTEKTGQIIGLSSGLVGSNTDTKTNERKAKSIHSLSDRKYTLEQTNFDVALRYEEIDGWAHVVRDFPARINKKVAESMGISLITMGMNGKSRAKDSDFSQNALLQDVAKGWLQKQREENPTRTLGWQTGAVGTTEQKIRYGNGASDYKNLDAVVTDCMNELVDERFADRTDFIVLASRRTVGDKYLRIVNQSGDKATELEAGGRLNQSRTLGGLPVLYVPNMPQNTLLITPLQNLSIYYQTGGERRQIIDNPKRDQLESYQSKNIDFVIEEYGAAVLVENLEHVA